MSCFLQKPPDSRAENRVKTWGYGGRGAGRGHPQGPGGRGRRPRKSRPGPSRARSVLRDGAGRCLQPSLVFPACRPGVLSRSRGRGCPCQLSPQEDDLDPQTRREGGGQQQGRVLCPLPGDPDCLERAAGRTGTRPVAPACPPARPPAVSVADERGADGASGGALVRAGTRRGPWRARFCLSRSRGRSLAHARRPAGCPAQRAFCLRSEAPSRQCRLRVAPARGPRRINCE